MIRKSTKYLLIVFTNLLLLLGLLVVWTDFIELTFNNGVRLIELLKIIGVSFLSLLGIRIVIVIFRKRNTALKHRIRTAITLTFLISSFLFVSYTQKDI